MKKCNPGHALIINKTSFIQGFQMKVYHCLISRLCEVKTGDVVCDPMCGSGSIPIQVGVGNKRPAEFPC